MLSEFFVSPARIRAIRGGPSAPRIEDFANHLYQSGYAKISARRHIRSAEHVVHWAIRRDLSVDELDDHALKRFEAHLPRCRCGRFARCGANRMETLSGVRLFVEFLCGSESAKKWLGLFEQRFPKDKWIDSRGNALGKAHES